MSQGKTVRENSRGTRIAAPRKGFNDTAEKLARNPLGIVALFIVLVYGIAALLLGVSSASLDATDRTLLVRFLVLFPVAVLGVFYRLVTAHHTKLYAPHDFHDRDGFFRALTPSERRKRLDREIRELEAPTSDPEKRKTLSVEMESSGLFRPPSRQAWVLAEEFAFRELEEEFGVPVNRQVAVVGSEVEVDGALVKNRKPMLIEVKFTQADRLAFTVQRAFDHLVKLSQDTCASSFMAAIVVEGMQSLRPTDTTKAKELVKTMPAPILLRLYDFDELKRKYGIDASDTSAG